jgi:hypothetical protein
MIASRNWIIETYFDLGWDHAFNLNIQLLKLINFVIFRSELGKGIERNLE